MRHSYNVIETHYLPGLDEITAISFLRHYGDSWGISSNTPVTFMTNGDFENPPMSEVPGTLYVGCGRGSWANEHFGPNNENESATSLVSRELGIKMNRYGLLVDEVTREDRRGSDGVKDHIAQAIKDLYDMGWDFERVFRWVNTAIIALTDCKSRPKTFAMDVCTCAESIEEKFGDDTKQKWLDVVSKIKKWSRSEFIRACTYVDKNPQSFIDVDTYKGTMRAFVPDEVQDLKKITAAARSRGAQIVLMQGQLDFDQDGILLQQGKDAKLSFSIVLEELRKHELLSRGELDKKKVGLCSGEGTLELCPVWHGQQATTGQNEAFAVFNRSKSRPCGPKTSLTWEHITGLVFETLKQTPNGEIVKGANLFTPGGLFLQSSLEGH